MGKENLDISTYYPLVKCDINARKGAEFFVLDVFFTKYEAEKKISEMRDAISAATDEYEIRGDCSASDKLYIHDIKHPKHHIVYTIQKVTTKNRPTAMWRHLGNFEWGCSRCGQIISTENCLFGPEDQYCRGCGAHMQIEYRK